MGSRFRSAASALPVGGFGSVMGIAGTGLAWRAGSSAVDAPSIIGDVLLVIAALVFGVLSALYLTKAAVTPSRISAELAAPSSASQFGCISISIVMLAAGILPYSRPLAVIMWCIGAVLQFAFCLFVFGQWIENPTTLSQATPTWLIPIVGNATAVMAGARLGFQEISWFLFSIGVVCWLAFLPILLNRMIFHHDPMADSAAPSVAIFVSAPAVGAIAWLQLEGEIDAVFRILLFSALFFAILVLRLYKTISRAPISAAWWAYTFPSATLALGFVAYARVLAAEWSLLVAWSALFFVSAIVIAVSVATAILGFQSFRNRSSLSSVS